MVLTQYTAISRTVVGKNVQATIPKGNMGYDQYTVPDDCSCRTYFCCFPLALANIRPWPLVSFFQTSLKNSEFKTTHNTFRDCRVHFFRNLFRNSCELGKLMFHILSDSFCSLLLFFFLKNVRIFFYFPFSY